ncbi:MAG: hypothetical protein KDJ25_10430 [Rhodoblastus sp.]|nr:hypothetical protein [Rhodoblastus sp.]
MKFKKDPRVILSIMLTLGAILGLIIIADGVYLYSFGGWPIWEDRRLAHGIFHRFSGVILVINSILFYGVAVRLRQPRWAILPFYILSLFVILDMSLIALDEAWKGEWRRFLLLSAALAGLALIAAIFGTGRRAGASDSPDVPIL